MPVAASRVVHRAPARAMTRGSPNPKSRGPPPVRVGGGVRDPLKGWAREDGALAGAFSFQYAVAGSACLGLKLIQIVEAGVAAQVAGGVDDGLDPHRPAVFEVLPDPRMLVKQVGHHAATVRAGDRPVDGSAEHAGGAAADVAVKDDPGVGGAADIQVVSDQGLEERPGPAGGIEHQGAGDPGLAHGDLPPVPGPLIARAEGQREAMQPPLGEHLDGARLQPVADLLQSGRVLAGREAVGQLGKRDPGLGGLPLGPLVPVDPDLGRAGEIRADLDERRAEISVPQVEVVAGHPPVSLGEGELRRRGLGVALIGGPDSLELLRPRSPPPVSGRPPPPALSTGPSRRPCGHPWRT